MVKIIEYQKIIQGFISLGYMLAMVDISSVQALQVLNKPRTRLLT